MQGVVVEVEDPEVGHEVTEIRAEGLDPRRGEFEGVEVEKGGRGAEGGKEVV